jgi:hypothetical protein
MFAIGKLMSAVATLADALTALAGTVATANAALRERLALEDTTPHAIPQLPEQPEGESRRRGRKTGE